MKKKKKTYSSPVRVSQFLAGLSNRIHFHGIKKVAQTQFSFMLFGSIKTDKEHIILISLIL